MNDWSPEQITATPVTQIANLSSEVLFALKALAETEVTRAKAVMEQLESALDLKYRTQAHTLRLAAGKDTGVIHFTDGRVEITADLPKKVEWDQAKLAEISQRIAASGEKPTQYIDVSYRVSESKFNAWPDTIKNSFLPARTLKTGKAGFRLALTQGASS